jgi:uncharacterized tellurite resistance protein B-like protein
MNQVEAVAVLLVLCGMADGELATEEVDESQECLVQSQGVSSDVAMAAIISAGAGLKASTKDAFTNAMAALMKCNQAAKEDAVTAIARVAASDGDFADGEFNFLMIVAKCLEAGPYAS